MLKESVRARPDISFVTQILKNINFENGRIEIQENVATLIETTGKINITDNLLNIQWDRHYGSTADAVCAYLDVLLCDIVNPIQWDWVP